jgi:Ca2+-binding EF-hand superfamily protein
MKLLLVCALAAAVSGAAFAQPTPPKGPPPAGPPGAPSAHGVFLSPSGEPFRPTAAAPDPLKTWFEQADGKHLGYLDREAFRADAVRFFKKLDENGDGVIDGFEVADYEHKLVPELGEEAEGRIAGMGADRGSDQGGGSGSGQPGRPGGGRHRGGEQGEGGQGAETGRSSQIRPPASRISQLIGEPEPVSGADFNLDSRITLDEWLQATDQRFDILDQAKTGKLTLDELRARFKPLPK